MNGNAEPLATECSLCGRGYIPTMKIDIANEPMKDEYRWAHVQCMRDHDRIFMETFGGGDQ